MKPGARAVVWCRPLVVVRSEVVSWPVERDPDEFHLTPIPTSAEAMRRSDCV